MKRKLCVRTINILGVLLLLGLSSALYVQGKGDIKSAALSSCDPFNNLEPIPIIILWLTGVTTVGLGRTMLRRLSNGRQVIITHARAGERDRARRRAVLLGAGPQAAHIIHGIQEDPELRYDIIGILDDRKARGTHVHDTPVLGPIAGLHRLLAEQAVDEIIVAVPDTNVDEIREYVIECRRRKLPVKVAPRLSEIPGGKSKFRLLDFSVEASSSDARSSTPI